MTNEEYQPMNSNNVDFLNEHNNLSYSPIQENDMELESLPKGKNLSSNYQVKDDDLIKNKMFNKNYAVHLAIQQKF